MAPTELSRLTAAVRQWLGISPTAEQAPELARFLSARLAALGCSAEEYCARLSEPRELQALAARLTIAETCFYRFAPQWEALAAGILPEALARARARGRKARFWSAGCCTGEEPYTIAILVAEAGRAGDVEILATDVNEGYLERAKMGKFSARSLRHLPPPLAQKYFEARGGAFWLDESIRRRVRFAQLNLADSGYPGIANGTSGLDVIFCQNVLIYFDGGVSREAIGRLTECLEDGGVLALGPSEMLPAGARLAVRQVQGAFFYVKGAPAAHRAPAALKGSSGRVPSAAPMPPEALDALERVSALAGQGLAEAARELCREVADVRPLEPRAHYLLGLLEYDEPQQARAHFRRALYLDPGHLLARLHAARCAQRLGRRREAARDFATLGRLAARRPPDDLLDAEEGLTCGMLTALCRRQSKEDADAMDDRH